MNAQLILTLLGAGGIPVIVTAIIKFVDNRRSLQASKPKVDAVAIDLGVGAQGKALANLTLENERLIRRADTADAKVEALEVKADLREARLEETVRQARVEFEERVRSMQASFDQKISQYHQENLLFRQRVEALLVENKIALPSWWSNVKNML